MRYIKTILFELRNGLLNNKMLFICPVCIAAVAFTALFGQIQRLVAEEVLLSGADAFGDYWLYLYGGMKGYTPDLTTPFLFPVVWVMLFLTIPFLLVNYPFRDMQGFGQQIMTRTRGRSLWWLSKCLWNISCTIVYHVLLVFTLVLLCVLHGIPLTSRINKEILDHTFHVWSGQAIVPHMVFILPTLISIGVNLFQMTLSLFLKPLFSFLVTAVLLLSSAYLTTPYMIGNYAMPVRYQWFMKESNILNNTGFCLSILLVLFSVVAGLFRFRYYDILNRE